MSDMIQYLSKMILTKIIEINKNITKDHIDKCEKICLDFSTIKTRIRAILSSFVSQGYLSTQLGDLIYYGEGNLCFLNNHLRQLMDDMDWHIPTEKDVEIELLDVQHNFGIIKVNNNIFSIISPHIQLESDSYGIIDFGKFEISVNLEFPWQADMFSFIKAVAITPNRHPEVFNITHPHVKDDGICFGDHHAIIKQALTEGRIKDFFELIIKLLQTYNNENPFASLDSWFKSEEEPSFVCDRCGYESYDELEDYRCESCNQFVCGDCIAYCEYCRKDICNNCIQSCQGCGESICNECQEKCDSCKELYCPDCLHSCPSCDTNVCENCEDSCSNCGSKTCQKCTQCKNCGERTNIKNIPGQLHLIKD